MLYCYNSCKILSNASEVKFSAFERDLEFLLGLQQHRLSLCGINTRYRLYAEFVTF